MTLESRPTEHFSARYFDGLSANSNEVFAWVTAEGVSLVRAGGETRHWPFAEIVVMRPGGRGEPVQLERRSQPVEVLVVHDAAFGGLLRAALPSGSRLERAGGWSPSLRAVIAMVAAGGLLLFATYRFGIPALADFAAARIPVKWEQDWGRALIDQMVPVTARVDTAVVARPVRAIHRALASEAGGGAGETQLIIMRADEPNAFAAPGGMVVVTTGLLAALRTPNGLAAVLAHELGHVQRRHVIRNVLRQLSLQVLLGLIAGDQTAMSSGLRAAGDLGGLSYSRADERQADDEAVALLERVSLSPEALVQALDDIRTAAGAGPALGFLSTHPAPEERRARILKAAKLGTATTAAPGGIGEDDWHAMKAALRELRPTK